MSTSTIIDAFFVNVNKNSVPATVPEQSEAVVPSTSYVMVTEKLLYCDPLLGLFALSKHDHG